LCSNVMKGFPAVTLVDVSLGKGRAVLVQADFPLQSRAASMPTQLFVADMMHSHRLRKGSGKNPATDSLIVRYRLRMVVAALLGTCALILLIVTAGKRSFLSVSCGRVVGVFNPDDWADYRFAPYKGLGNAVDMMKTAGRVFLCLAIATGLVSVALMWSAVCRLCWMPQPATALASIGEQDCTTKKQLARTWSAATVAAALCALTGALVFLLFGAKECQVTCMVGHVNCVTELGSYVLMASVLLWSFLVVIRTWVAPVCHAAKDVAGKVEPNSEDNVAEDSPEILKGIEMDYL
jgi:hypothetical protein